MAIPGPFPEWTLRIVGPHEVSQGATELATLLSCASAEELGPACPFVGARIRQEELEQRISSGIGVCLPECRRGGRILRPRAA